MDIQEPGSSGLHIALGSEMQSQICVLWVFKVGLAAAQQGNKKDRPRGRSWCNYNSRAATAN